MSKFNEALSALAEDRKNKKSQAEEARKRAKGDLLEKIRVVFDEFPDLQKLAVRRATPSFNDGDICRHSQYDVILNGWGDDDEEEVVEVSDVIKNNYNAINRYTFLLDELFELAFETNFKVTFSRKGDEITMSHGWYDCGY